MALSLSGKSDWDWVAPALLIAIVLSGVIVLFSLFSLFTTSSFSSHLSDPHPSPVDPRTMDNLQPESAFLTREQSLLDTSPERIDFRDYPVLVPPPQPGRVTSKFAIRMQSPIEVGQPSPVQPVKAQDSLREVCSNFFEPRWTVPAKIFNKHHGKVEALKSFDYTASSMLPFVQYGLRYVPGDGEEDEYFYRSVLIDKLPATVHLDQILAGVRGGAVYSACLVDTTPLTASPAALITFVTTNGATVFYQKNYQHGFFIGLHRAVVRRIYTPTYPLSRKVELHIKGGHTRCLVVRSKNPQLVKNIYSILSKLSLRLHVEYFGKGLGGRDELHIRFFSIKMAIAAREILVERVQFYDFRINFAPDPCAQP